MKIGTWCVWRGCDNQNSGKAAPVNQPMLPKPVVAFSPDWTSIFFLIIPNLHLDKNLFEDWGTDCRDRYGIPNKIFSKDSLRWSYYSGDDATWVQNISTSGCLTIWLGALTKCRWKVSSKTQPIGEPSSDPFYFLSSQGSFGFLTYSCEKLPVLWGLRQAAVCAPR